MAERFNLTAQLQLQANTNSVNRTVSNIKKQLAPISNVKMNVQTNARSLAQASKQAKEFNKGLQSSNRSASELNRTLVESARRFSVITIATGSLLSLANAFKRSVKDAIAFEAELVKISQVTGKSVGNLRGLSDEVTRLSTSLGVSSASLLNTSRILLQTGLSADKARKALDVLAKTTLAATFDDIQSTTEGAIALLNQFGAQAAKTGNDIAFLEKSLDAINAVSKNFAVESGDLVSAIRRVGGVFANAGGSVEELVALFTSVRATTRESAETIATGLRTIFTRIQRQDTIDQLKNLGIVLQDAQGNFVGAFEAVQRLSKGLSGLDPRSFRFSSIVEELGGFRQIGKVIPLINQFTVAQQALNVAQNASGSISKDAQTAQQALATEISKTREQFDALIRSFSDSGTFRSIIVGALKLAQAFIKIADSLEPLLPLLTGLFALKAGQGLAAGIGLLRGAGGAARGVQASKFAAGGMVPGTGNRDSVPAMLTPGEFVIRKQSVNKIGASNLAQMNAKGYAGGGVVINPKNIGVLTRDEGNPADRIPPPINLLSKDRNVPKGLLKSIRKAGYTDQDIVKAGVANIGFSSPIQISGFTKSGEFAKQEDAVRASAKSMIANLKQSATKAGGTASTLEESRDKIFKGLNVGFGNAFEAYVKAIVSQSSPGSKNFDIQANESAALSKYTNEKFKAGMRGDIKLNAGDLAIQSMIKKAANDGLYNLPIFSKLKKSKTTKKKATGGGISGSDTVPAMLTPGEFVFSKSAAQSIGYANLNKMNKQGVTGYAQGGAVGVQHFATGGPTRSGIKQVTNLRTAGLQKDIAATSARMKLYGAEIEKVARQRGVELRQQQQLLSAQARLTQQIAALDKAQLTLKKSAEDGAKGNRALYKIHEMVAKKQEQLNQTTDKLSSVQSQLEKSEKKKLAASDKLAAAEEKRANLISQARNLKQGVTPGLTSGNQTTFNQSGMTYAAKGAAALPAATGGLGTLGKSGQTAANYLQSFGASAKTTAVAIKLYEKIIKQGGSAQLALTKSMQYLTGKTAKQAQTSDRNIAEYYKAAGLTKTNNTLRQKMAVAMKTYASNLKNAAMVGPGQKGQNGKMIGGRMAREAASMQGAANATQSLQMLAFMGTAMGAAATQALGLSDAMGEAVNQTMATATTMLFLGSTILDLAASFGTASVEKAAAAAAAKADLDKAAAAEIAAGADLKKAGAGGAPGGPVAAGMGPIAGGLVAVAAAAAIVVVAFQAFVAYWNATADELAKKTEQSLNKLAETGEGSADQIQKSIAAEVDARNKANSFRAGRNVGAGAAAGGALAGAALGAAIGSSIPVIGTLVGAVVGLTVGAIAYKSAQAEAEAAARKEAEAVNAAVDSLVNLSKAQADARNRLQEIANLPLEADQRVDARLSAGVDTAGEASFSSVNTATEQLTKLAAKTGKSFNDLANITDEDLKKLKGVSESERAIIKLRSKELGQGLKGLQDNLQESRQTLSDAASLELTGDRDFSEIMADPSSRFAQALKQNERLIMLEAKARASQIRQQAEAAAAAAGSQDEMAAANALFAEAASIEANAVKVAKEQQEAYDQVNIKAKEQKDAIALEIAARRAVIAQLKQQQAQLNAIRNMTKGFELAAAGVNDFTANLQGNVAKVEIQDVELGEDLPLGQLAVNLTKFQNTIASLPPQFQRSGQQAAQALLNTRTFIERAGEGLQNLDKEFLGTATADQILGKLNISDSDLFKQLKDTKSVEKFKSDLTDAAKGGIISPDDVDKLFAPFQASAEGYAKEINALAEASRQQLELFRSQTAQEQAVREQNISNLEKYNQVVSAGAERLAKFTGGSAAAARGRAEVQSRQRTLDAGQQSRGGIKLEAGNARQLAAVKKNAEAMLTATRAQIQHARATNADAATIAKLERKQQQLINTTNDAQEALLEMANSTAKFDELTEALDKEIAIREQAYAVLKEFVAGGQSTRDALNQGAAGIMNALRTGTTQNMSEEDRGATFDLLSKLEDVQIGSTGLTGGQVANELVFRDAVRLGFPPDIARQLATQTTTEEQILEELKKQTAISQEVGGLAFAAGGQVPGAGNKDSVPAMLTPGEFVINKQAAGKLGLGALQHLNRGGMVQYFSGGGRSLNKDKTQVLFEDGSFDVDTTRKLLKARNAFEQSAAGTREITFGLMGNRAFDAVKWLESEGFKVDPERAKGRAATAVRDQYDKAADAASKVADYGDAVPKFFQNFLDAYDFLGKKDKASNDAALAEIQKYRGGRLNESISDYMERGNQQKASAEYAALAEKGAAASRRFNARERLPKGAMADPNFVLDETREEQTARNYSNAVLREINARITGQIDNLLKTGSVNKPVAAMDLQKQDEKRYNALANSYETIAFDKILRADNTREDLKPVLQGTEYGLGLWNFPDFEMHEQLHNSIMKELSQRFAFGDAGAIDEKQLARAFSRKVGYKVSDELYWYPMHLQDYVQRGFKARHDNYVEIKEGAKRLADRERAEREAVEDAEDEARLARIIKERKVAPSYTWRAYGYIDPTDPSKGIDGAGQKYSSDGIYLGAKKVAGKDNLTIQKTVSQPPIILDDAVDIPIELLDQDSKKLGRALYNKYGRDATDDYNKSFLVYKANGGSIFKPRGTDTVPAMLTPGEFVIKKSSVDKIGANNLSALNNGQAAVVRSNGGPIYRSGGGPVNYLQQGGQGQQQQQGVDFENAATLEDGINALGGAAYKQFWSNAIRGLNPKIARAEMRTAGASDEAFKDLQQLLKTGKFDPSKFLGKQVGEVASILDVMNNANRSIFTTLNGGQAILGETTTLNKILTWQKTYLAQYKRYTAIKKSSLAGDMVFSALEQKLGVPTLENYNSLFASVEKGGQKIIDAWKKNPANKDAQGKIKPINKDATILQLRSNIADLDTDVSSDLMKDKVGKAGGAGGAAGAAGSALRAEGLYLKRGGIAYYNNGGENSADRIPAMLTPGEFVMSPEAVQKYGVGYMKSLNRGVVPGFRRGGMVGSGNVRYRANGSSGPESGGGGTLSVDTSNLQEVLTGFSSSFTESINNVIGTFNTLNTSMTALANAISGGMVITHQFSGDMKMAFNIQNADHLKNAIAEALTPKISEIIRTEIENRLDGDFQAGGG